jgi:nucleolar protein 15
MLATRTTAGAPKKSKHEKRPIGELTKEPSSKSKSKAIKTAQADISSPLIPSKGKKRKEEADVSDEEELGGTKKAKRAKKVSVDDVEKKAGEETKSRKESKDKKTEDNTVSKGAKEERPVAKTKKSKKVADESEVEVVVKSPPKTRKLPLTSREPVQPSSPELETPSDFGHITDDDDDDDDDSSDEEDDIVDIPELGVLKLHTVLKDDATVKRKLEQAKRQPVMNFSFHVWALLILSFAIP